MFPITLVCDRPPLASGVDAGPDRRFLAELRERSRQQVPVRYVRLNDMSVVELLQIETFVILDSANPEGALADLSLGQQTALANRLVLLGVQCASDYDRELEHFSVIAAVDKVDFETWQKSEPENPGCGTVYGRREVGELHIRRLAPGSGSYRYLFSPVCCGLPHLLAEYLSAVSQLRLPA